MRKVILFIGIFLTIWSSYSNSDIDSTWIYIKWKYIDGTSVYKSIEKNVNKKSMWNISNKIRIYNQLINKFENLENENPSENLTFINNILHIWINNAILELQSSYFKLNKVTLWYTKLWTPIIAYYKWNPEKWYFWIFSDIHWWYEYWTYNSALYLLDELNKSGKTWRFLIPTLNPDWLEYYNKNWTSKTNYIEWRSNSNNVDLNRNFCTSSFELKSFLKNWVTFQTWIWWCNSEEETKIVINTLKKYNFNSVIDLHSQWNIFFIPENSFNDQKVIDFWKKLKKYLPSYDFDTAYNTQTEKSKKVIKYEIDEWWISIFTWTMWTYIYENYNIPVITLELKNHWEIEYQLKNIFEMF